MNDWDRRHAELLGRLDRQIEYAKAMHRRLAVLEALAVVAALVWAYRTWA